MPFQKIHSFIAHTAPVYSLTPGIEDHQFYSASGDKFIAGWNLNDMCQEKFSVNIGSPVYSVALLRDVRLLIAGNHAGAFHVIDLEKRQELHLFAVHEKGIFDMTYNEDRALLYIAGGDGAISIWSVPQFEMIRRIPLCDSKIRKIAINRIDHRIAVACGDGFLRILEPDFLNETHSIKAHQDGVTSVAWHPKKPLLLSGGKDAWLRTWNADKDFTELLSIPAHQFAIYAIAFHPYGDKLATASRDKTIKIWNANNLDIEQKIDARIGGHTHSVNKIIWCGEKLISCGDDRQIIVWQQKDASLS